MTRGEIHQLATGKSFLVVQADAVTIAAPTVIALPITTLPQRAGYPLTVALDPAASGLPEPAWVKVTAPQTLPRAALTGPLAELDRPTQDQVDHALAAILGLEAP